MADTAALPAVGLITFEAEGNNNPSSIYFSRRAHVPSDSSGVTIGRGYDMRERSKSRIIADLKNAGVPETECNLLANGAGLKGETAKIFIKKEDIKKIVISEGAQKVLFENIYDQYFTNAIRICTKKDVTAKYGECKWNLFSKELRELVADLLYRGDYSPTTRNFLQRAIISQDPVKIKKALAQLKGVPADRAARRLQLVNAMDKIEATATEFDSSQTESYLKWTPFFTQ